MNEETIRLAIEVRGRVQGVGFRPFVYRTATELGLAGEVGNNDRGVFIEVEGLADAVQTFLERLEDGQPPLARIGSLEKEVIATRGGGNFVIARSENGSSGDAAVTPDTALCGDCLAEMSDRRDRRFRYGFINCTNCGPRYSIIHSVPYDREASTMAGFAMCPACRKEYDDPENRRFHAQPNACPECGPRAWLADRNGESLPGDPYRLAAGLLLEGKIVAVKGLGGFHLACRADSDDAVNRLRRRKGREAKPFAVLAADVEQARTIVRMDETTEAALTDPARPIVLLEARSDSGLSGAVAPSVGTYGVLLPYTPIHVLLVEECGVPLVLTSGNPTAEPLCRGNGEARERLGSIADAFLLHDRKIARPIDDSVVTCVTVPDLKKGRKQDVPGSAILPLRRARGYVPDSIRLARGAPVPIVGLGGELKSTVCFLSGNRAVVSEHLGELENPAAFRNFLEAIDRLGKLLAVEPQAAACDSHPAYAATRHARSLGLPLFEVQHHHAHIVSCMAENGVDEPVIGIACDGTGYGMDGNLWGCEILQCDAADFRRTGSLRCFPLVGGDAAARQTWRPAAGLLHTAFGESWRESASDFFEEIDQEAVAVTARRIERNSGVVSTSSLGRLFDAAAFLLGICSFNRFEAEAAMALEAAARQSGKQCASWRFSVSRPEEGAPYQFDLRPAVRQLLLDRRAGIPVPDLALTFHETVAAGLAECARRTARESGIERAALSGGCFANRLLFRLLAEKLQDTGLDILFHNHLPPGDGGISLGQAVSAAARLERS